MLPIINGKEIIDCTLEDFQGILDNPDYAENEYLDYKKDFAIDAAKDNNTRQLEQAEFRNDVCAFANTNGGYLIYGIKEKKGIPTEITGINIQDNNKDLFERNIKNYLQIIKPRMPYYSIKFIDVQDNRFIVVIYVQHDFYAPYIHLVDQKNYKIYKRAGNGKIVMDYQEIKNMFIQSISIEKEVELKREERINFFLSQRMDLELTYSKFFLMHIIPETFLDYNYNKPMFVLEQKGARFSPIFSFFDCGSLSAPTPEGLRYLGQGIKAEGKISNNGIAEFFYPLTKKLHIGLHGKDDKGQLPYEWFWQRIDQSIRMYIDVMKQYTRLQRIFICISIVGCKDVLVEQKFDKDWESRIDRDKLLCNPSVFDLTDAVKIKEDDMSRLHLDFLTSLGVKFNGIIPVIIESLYGQN